MSGIGIDFVAKYLEYERKNGRDGTTNIKSASHFMSNYKTPDDGKPLYSATNNTLHKPGAGSNFTSNCNGINSNKAYYSGNGSATPH